MANQIVNLAKVPDVGLIVELKLSQGRAHVARALSTKRAVFANGKGLVSRVADLPEGSQPFVESQEVTSLVVSVSGSPVIFVGFKYDGVGANVPFTLLVTSLLVLDQPLAGGFTLTTTGTSQVDLNYQN